jgi:MFS family permease
MPILASQTLGMSPGAIGGVFALVSAINVAGVHFSAVVSDRFGRRATMVPGLAIVSIAVGLLPLASSGPELAALMALWGCGAAVYSVGPTAFMADLGGEADRGQALAMLRVCGDGGLLLGAGSMGLLAHNSSIEVALGCCAALLAAATTSLLWAKEPPREVLIHK